MNLQSALAVEAGTLYPRKTSRDRTQLRVLSKAAILHPLNETHSLHTCKEERVGRACFSLHGKRTPDRVVRVLIQQLESARQAKLEIRKEPRA